MRGGWPGVIALVAATAVAIAQSRPANACSCGYQLDTFPRDGEVDVPPNAIPRVYSSIDDPFLFNEYRLYVQGQERPVDVELELTERPFARESILWLRPIYGLIADTTYEIRSREIQDRSAEELIVSMSPPATISMSRRRTTPASSRSRPKPGGSRLPASRTPA